MVKVSKNNNYNKNKNNYKIYLLLKEIKSLNFIS